MTASGVSLDTTRGAYRLTIEETAALADGLLLTVSIQHRRGLEKFALRVRIARESASAGVESDTLERIAGRIGPRFEQIREAALKSIRTERKLLEIAEPF